MQLSRLGGEVETLKKQSEDITEQLNEEYKNVKSEYRNQLIKVKVSFLKLHIAIFGFFSPNLVLPVGRRVLRAGPREIWQSAG